MTKFTAAASVVLALVAGSAFAADLPARKAAPVYVPPAPTFSWTGLYGGVNIGYGFGAGGNEYGGLGYVSSQGFPLPPVGEAWSLPSNLNGVLGGGQVGYNLQFNPWLVVGVETDIQAADVHTQSWGASGAPGSATGVAGTTWLPHSGTIYSAKSVDWFGTLRGRVGLTLPSYPNLLVYGTGGLAYGQVVHTANANDFFYVPGGAFTGGNIIGAKASYDDTKVGWTAGGGIEWTPLPYSAFSAFSVKVEYLYTDLGNTTIGGGTIATMPVPGLASFAYSHNSPTRFSTVRAGLNWHFNPFAAAPVVAKY
jgi:outer membrane immunogenic protein